jgi:hypothetical protein
MPSRGVVIQKKIERHLYICTITGPVDWVASNPNSAQSQGSAQFEYRVRWSDQGPAIIHESSKALDRTGWRKQ